MCASLKKFRCIMFGIRYVLCDEVAAGDFKSTGIVMMLVLRDAFI